MPGTRILGVVLAAGLSRRMGTTKQLLPWGDTTVLGQTLRHVRASKVDAVLVVTGHQAEAVAEVAAVYGADVVHNPAYAYGEMLSSLQLAVARLEEGWDAVLVMLADQPLVRPETLNLLLEAYRSGAGTLIAPVHAGRRGNPVIIDRRHFAELLALSAGSAPRDLLRRHPQALHLVAVATDEVLVDLDDWETYQRLRPPESSVEADCGPSA